MTNFSDRISYIRKTILNLNQQSFAKLILLSQGALSDVEHGKRGLTQDSLIELYKLSKEHKFSFEWLLLGTGDIVCSSTLTKEEEELLSNYKKLDTRGVHVIHATMYKELDRINE